MKREYKFAILLGLMLSLGLAIWPFWSSIFMSKKTQFFAACNRSNQAMLFVYGKNHDKSSPCGKCWDSVHKRLDDHMDVRMLAIMRSCANVMDGCDAAEGTVSCDCIASHIQSDECFEAQILVHMEMAVPCEDICRQQLSSGG